VGVHGSIVDLARDRDDGCDLTNWLADRQPLHAADLRRALAAPDTRTAQLRRAPPRGTCPRQCTSTRSGARAGAGGERRSLDRCGLAPVR
jgi:hypothetical protein